MKSNATPASAIPPHSTTEIDTDAVGTVLQAAIKQMCRRLLKGCGDVKDWEMEVSFISGGISNALYKVSFAVLAPTAEAAAAEAEPGPPPAVAFRVYGTNTEKFVDRERELGLMRLLHAHGFGPELLGTFSNGRIESFLAMRCLTPQEMASAACAPAIAATLARFHAVEAGGRPAEHAEPATPFGRIREWLGIARGLDFSDAPAKQALFATFDFDHLTAELDRVEAAAARVASPVVFAHNDLLSGNIMVPLDAQAAGPRPAAGAAGAPNAGELEPTAAAEATAAAAAGAGGARTGLPAGGCEGTPTAPPGIGNAPSGAGMTFIDFEYSDWAPRGFDWGNHFCEYAGFDCDYGLYPGPQAAAAFLRPYLAAASGRVEAAVDGDEVAAAVAEANVFALAAHMYWGSWAIMQFEMPASFEGQPPLQRAGSPPPISLCKKAPSAAGNTRARWSAIDFDYMSYAKLRWRECERRRDEFLAAAEAAFAHSPAP